MKGGRRSPTRFGLDAISTRHTYDDESLPELKDVIEKTYSLLYKPTC